MTSARISETASRACFARIAVFALASIASAATSQAMAQAAGEAQAAAPGSPPAAAGMTNATRSAGAPAPGLCLVVAEVAGSSALEVVPLDRRAPVFALNYVHPTTRTPVQETYRVGADGITQTSVSFEQPGPGLPTEGTAGEKWERRDGRTLVTMAQPVAGIRMHATPEQKPVLIAAGKRYALDRWGSRALAVGAVLCDVRRP